MSKNEQNFILPSADAITEIAKDNGLNDVQKHELNLSLQHAHADLEGFFRTRIDRKDKGTGIDQLKKVCAKLHRLNAALGNDPDKLTDILPFEARETIGWFTSTALITGVTGRQFPADPELIKTGSRAAGLLSGGRILKEQVTLLISAIEPVLQEKSADKGGDNPNFVRRQIIASLAQAAPDIIGAKATATAMGPFICLIRDVFIACEISDGGLEKAVEAVLTPSRKRDGKLDTL
jgi:hypothetical protein